MKRRVGEGPAAVTDRTIGLTVKQRESTLSSTDCRFVTANPAVEGCLTGDDCALERSQSLLDFLSRHAAIAERSIESDAIAGYRRQSLNEVALRQIHI